MSHTVESRAFVRRAEVRLRCSECGTTTIRCHIDDRDKYVDLLSAHVCLLRLSREAVS